MNIYSAKKKYVLSLTYSTNMSNEIQHKYKAIQISGEKNMRKSSGSTIK